MISVPTSTGAAPTPTPATSGPDEVYLMMAAAQMHKEGRLIAIRDSRYSSGWSTTDSYSPTSPAMVKVKLKGT